MVAMKEFFASPLVPTASAHDPDVSSRFLEGLESAGCFLLLDAYSEEEAAALRTRVIELENRASPENPACRFQDGNLWAVWNLYEMDPSLMRLALLPQAFSMVAHFMGEPASLCRATLMKKTPSGSRPVEWHQDLAVAVDRDVDDEFSRGIRDGVPHRRAPDELYGRLLVARIHVDPQFADGGALKVIPGSHEWGVLDKPELLKRIAASEEVVVEAPAGSVFYYRPLVSHGSGPNERPFEPQFQRRVLHNEFRPESASPGEGFEWYPWKQRAVFSPEGVFFAKP